MSPHWCSSSHLPLAGQSHPLCALLTSFPNCNSLLWAADSFVVGWLLITFPCENTTSPVGADDRGSPGQLHVPRAGRLQTLAATCLCFYCRVHSLFFSTPWMTNAFPCEAWTHAGVFLSGFRCKYPRRNWVLWAWGLRARCPNPIGSSVRWARSRTGHLGLCDIYLPAPQEDECWPKLSKFPHFLQLGHLSCVRRVYAGSCFRAGERWQMGQLPCPHTRVGFGVSIEGPDPDWGAPVPQQHFSHLLPTARGHTLNFEHKWPYWIKYVIKWFAGSATVSLILFTYC